MTLLLIRLMVISALGEIAFAVLFMVLSAKYIRSDAPINARGMYSAFLKPEHFTDQKGYRYHRLMLLMVLAFLLSCACMALAISTLPEN